MKPYRIILADDHILLRNTLRNSIENFPDMKVIGEVSNGIELLQVLMTLQPDLIILDISMPQMRGIEAAQEIKKYYPKIKILILTMHSSEEHLRSALSTGVDGYLLKENAYEDLIRAIRTIQQGKRYISNLVSPTVKEIILQDQDRTKRTSALTLRERVILKLMAEGKSSREIAGLLFISVPTVNRHRFNIKHKLASKSNADLIKYAIEKGYANLAHC
jgi:two-component system, NarL family, response regulator NreC